MCFNLLDRGWIPIIWRNGTPDRVGIRDVLANASEIREVSAASPLGTVALYRFLLAVLQWCKPDPTDDEIREVRTADRLPDDWSSKLDKHRGRFELLGDQYGFYQERSAWEEVERQLNQKRDKKKLSKENLEEADANEKVGGLRCPSDLFAELPSGTNVAHFRHTRDRRDGVCAACCAVGLVRLSAFAPSLKHGKEQQQPAGLNGVKPLYALPIGATLLQTLLLNWPMGSRQRDTPGWMSDKKPAQGDIGRCSAFSWRPRRVWLGRPNGDCPREHCAYCGSEDRLIRIIAFLPGWPRERWDDDPHLLARVQKAKSKRAQPEPHPVSLPNPSNSVDSHAQFWRTYYRTILQSFIPDLLRPPPAQHAHLRNSLLRCEAEAQVTVACFGPATETGRVALYKDGNSLKWPLPVADLTATHAQQAIAELGDLDDINLRDILRSASPTKGTKQPEIDAALANEASQTEADLRQHFEEFADALASNQPNAVDQWRTEAKECLAQTLHQACDAIAKGSPLRRKQQQAALRDCLGRAIAKLANNKTKEVKHEAD